MSFAKESGITSPRTCWTQYSLVPLLRLSEAETYFDLETALLTQSIPVDTVLRRRNALIVFATLQLLDFLTTMAVFSRGGFELNPVVRSLMPWTGPAVAVLLCKASLVFLTWRLSRRPWIVNVGNVFYGIVVVWNSAQAFSILA